jgi:hypothetical protein
MKYINLSFCSCQRFNSRVCVAYISHCYAHTMLMEGCPWWVSNLPSVNSTVSSKSMNTLGPGRCLGKAVSLETEEYIIRAIPPVFHTFLWYHDRYYFDLHRALIFQQRFYPRAITYRIYLVYSAAPIYLNWSAFEFNR